MKYKINEILSIRISKKGLSYVDVKMLVSEYNEKAQTQFEIEKTFTRREFEKVRENGYFED